MRRPLPLFDTGYARAGGADEKDDGKVGSDEDGVRRIAIRCAPRPDRIRIGEYGGIPRTVTELVEFGDAGRSDGYSRGCWNELEPSP